MRITVETNRGIAVRVVDERGWVVARTPQDPNGVHVIDFAVDAAYSYLSPAIGTIPHEQPGATQRFSGRGYSLEFLLLQGQGPVHVSGSVDVVTTLGSM